MKLLVGKVCFNARSETGSKRLADIVTSEIEGRFVLETREMEGQIDIVIVDQEPGLYFTSDGFTYVNSGIIKIVPGESEGESRVEFVINVQSILIKLVIAGMVLFYVGAPSMIHWYAFVLLTGYVFVVVLVRSKFQGIVSLSKMSKS